MTSNVISLCTITRDGSDPTNFERSVLRSMAGKVVSSMSMRIILRTSHEVKSKRFACHNIGQPLAVNKLADCLYFLSRWDHINLDLCTQANLPCFKIPQGHEKVLRYNF